MDAAWESSSRWRLGCEILREGRYLVSPCSGLATSFLPGSTSSLDTRVAKNRHNVASIPYLGPDPGRPLGRPDAPGPQTRSHGPSGPHRRQQGPRRPRHGSDESGWVIWATIEPKNDTPNNPPRNLQATPHRHQRRPFEGHLCLANDRPRRVRPLPHPTNPQVLTSASQPHKLPKPLRRHPPPQPARPDHGLHLGRRKRPRPRRLPAHVARHHARPVHRPEPARRGARVPAPLRQSAVRDAGGVQRDARAGGVDAGVRSGEVCECHGVDGAGEGELVGCYRGAEGLGKGVGWGRGWTTVGDVVGEGNAWRTTRQDRKHHQKQSSSSHPEPCPRVQ